MKSNLGILIKYNFLMLLGSLKGKKGKKISTLTAWVILLAILGVVGYLCYFQASENFNLYGQMGLQKLVVFNGFTMGLSLLLVFSVLGVGSNKKANDEGLLLSMPLKKSEIVLSKTLVKYLYMLVIVGIYLTPYLLIYYFRYSTQFATLLLSIMVILLFPLCSVGITFIVDFIVGRLFNKSKLSGFFKSILTTLITIFVVVFVFIKGYTSASVVADTLEEYMADSFFSYQMVKLVCDNNYLSLITLLLLAFVPFSIGVTLKVVSFGKSKGGYVVKNKTLKFNSPKNQLSLMLKKEFGTYFSTPIYLSNTIIGPIIILALGVLVLIVGNNGFNALFDGVQVDKGFITALASFIFLSTCSMSSTSCSSISLEGNKVWILKSTPVNLNKVFLSKALVNFILLAPSILISAGLITLALKLSILQFLVLFGLPTLMGAFISFGGLFINLLLPKMEWQDEMNVVKQSMSVALTMLFGFLISASCLLTYIFSGLSQTGVALSCIGGLAVIDAVFITLLFTVGKKLFRRL